jgi:hypothetical protein
MFIGMLLVPVELLRLLAMDHEGMDLLVLLSVLLGKLQGLGASLPASRASVSRSAAGSRTTIYIGICTCPYYSKGHPDLTLP